MKAAAIIAVAIVLQGMGASVPAFPPAPHHELYGTVRDAGGDPLEEGATVTLLGTSGTILSGVVDPTIAAGVNYSLKVPMDAGTLAQLYQSNAMRPAMPFTVKVTVNGTGYVPIEVAGGMLQMGNAGERTRLDLTLGVDRDGDGLPDSWEEEVIAAIDGLDSLSQVTPEGDADRDGVSNYLEYLAGTYAFDKRAAFRFEIIAIEDGLTHLRFLAVKGRSYRVLSSASGEDFQPVELSFQPDGGNGVPVFRAQSIRYRDIYVPAVAPDGKQLYRLHVE